MYSTWATRMKSEERAYRVPQRSTTSRRRTRTLGRGAGGEGKMETSLSTLSSCMLTSMRRWGPNTQTQPETWRCSPVWSRIHGVSRALPADRCRLYPLKDKAAGLTVDRRVPLLTTQISACHDEYGRLGEAFSHAFITLDTTLHSQLLQDTSVKRHCQREAHG